MEELAHTFGLDVRLLTAQIVNFLVIFWLLKRFAYKPILKVLKDREQTITEGLQKAQEAQVRLEKATNKEKEILKKAQEEAKSLLDEAKNQKSLLLQEAKDAASLQVETMLKEAGEQITFETKEAEKRLSAHISKLAIRLIEKSVDQLFDRNEQDLILKHVVKKLKNKIN